MTTAVQSRAIEKSVSMVMSRGRAEEAEVGDAASVSMFPLCLRFVGVEVEEPLRYDGGKEGEPAARLVEREAVARLCS